MKVLHIVENFRGAGLENVVKDLVIGTISPHIQPAVCVLNQHGYCGTLVKEKGGQVFDLKAKQMNKSGRQVVKDLKNLIKQTEPDIIHAHNFTPLYYTILAACFSNIKIVVTFHGFIDWNIKKWLFYNTVFKRITVVVVNDAMKKNYLFLGMFFKKKINTIFNGINIDRYAIKTDTDLRRQLHIAPQDFVIGSVGRLSPVKNQALQVRVLAALKKNIPNIKLLLVTGGSPDASDLKENLLKEADRLDVKENFIILDFRKDVPELLSIMDVFLMTSLTEGTSLALLEAMASGLPAVVSDVGGNNKLISNGENGFLYSLDNEENLFSIIKNLFSDKNLRTIIGKTAFKTAVKYSTENMVQQYRYIYTNKYIN